ncbi:C40 family peptidase [Stenotrophomonas pictorum]|uniref:C40 family peptidase n=1 Tax=Stenotrophomonas pictorum TaxID=86184 RepID=UPI0009FAF5E4
MTNKNTSYSSQPKYSNPLLRRLFCAAALALTSLPALAQSAAEAEPAAAKPAAKNETPRSKADAAATATLAALLPHLAANDTIPLMDRSAMFAGDLSRLLSTYDASKSVATATDAALARDEDGKVQSILRRAMTLLGTPYRWGGTSPDAGFDCSGLVGYVFRTALGIELPRVSREMASQASSEMIKDRAALVAGDLVFFGRKGRIDHVGIYVGEGRFLHAPSTGKDVRTDSLLTGYWSGKFMQARRVEL